jgi:adenylylsulfate kinase-like enzyme
MSVTKKILLMGLAGAGKTALATALAPRLNCGTDENNPLDFASVKARIEAALWRHRGKFTVIQVPNIPPVYYGRKVG